MLLPKWVLLLGGDRCLSGDLEEKEDSDNPQNFNRTFAGGSVHVAFRVSSATAIGNTTGLQIDSALCALHSDCYVLRAMFFKRCNIVRRIPCELGGADVIYSVGVRIELVRVVGSSMKEPMARAIIYQSILNDL